MPSSSVKTIKVVQALAQEAEKHAQRLEERVQALSLALVPHQALVLPPFVRVGLGN